MYCKYGNSSNFDNTLSKGEVGSADIIIDNILLITLVILLKVDSII